VCSVDVLGNLPGECVVVIHACPASDLTVSKGDGFSRKCATCSECSCTWWSSIHCSPSVPGNRFVFSQQSAGHVALSLLLTCSMFVWWACHVRVGSMSPTRVNASKTRSHTSSDSNGSSQYQAFTLRAVVHEFVMAYTT
jgi:hypothetical protein